MPQFNGYQIVHATYFFWADRSERQFYTIYTIKDGRPEVERPHLALQATLDDLKKELKGSAWKKQPLLEGILELDQKIYIPDSKETRRLLERQAIAAGRSVRNQAAKRL